MNAEAALADSRGRERARPGLALALVALGAGPAPASGTAGLQGVDPAARVETYKRVGAVELAIHVYVPLGHSPTERRPALVLFFGGGWKSGEPGQLAAHCRYLAQRGLVAFTAEYRLLLRHRTRARESVQDAKSAIRWVRANAERLGVDPARIAAGGASSGGHLAACCAVIEGFEEPGEDTTVSSVPAALVLFNPPLGLAPFEGFVPEAEPGAETLAARLGTEPIELSPAHHVRAGAAPTILFYGSEDFLLPGARYFQRRMLAAGNRCELLLYEGEDHGFFHFGRADNVPFARTLEAVDRFLVSLGYLAGEPNVAEWLRPAAEPVQQPR